MDACEYYGCCEDAGIELDDIAMATRLKCMVWKS